MSSVGPPSVASSPPSPSSRSRNKVSTAAPPRPSSPAGSVNTAKSSVNSPRPVPSLTHKSYRRGPNSIVKSSGPLTRSTSNSSISRSISGNSNINHVLPPPLSEVDHSSMGNASTPLPTPINYNANNGSLLFNEPMTGSSPNQSQNPNHTIQPDPQNLDHRRSLPRPLSPSRCPLLCVFYAEFDIVVGPKVCFQSPKKFMHLDVDVSYEDVHHSLEETFQTVIPREDEKEPVVERDSSSTNNKNGNKQPCGKHSVINADIKQQDSVEYWNWSSTSKTTIIERETSDMSSQITLPSSGHKDDKQTANATGSASGTEGSIGAKSIGGKESNSSKQSHERIPDKSTNNDTSTTAQLLTHSRNPSFASSSKGTTSNPPTHEGDTSTIDTELLQNSIFAATSEYIITGNELANQTITVSTHGMHILSRPMIICDTQRYERNSLLFAVGFVLRRNVDPRPYWPVLSNLSSTFRAMEVESEFLSHYRTRQQIQFVLEDILISLNSRRKDCHLVLDDANMLNLHLFRPPPPPTPPVPDYAVPILLRPEWQLQMYDWDLTINWIVPHIDGCKYVKQIAISSEVDMEMVRACLRVLRHHGVLAYVDVFRYSNVYEYTPLAMGLLTGSGKKADELKDAAFWYSAKAKYARQARAGNNDRNSPSFSPSSNATRRLHLHRSSLHSLDLSVHSSTTPCASEFASETSRRWSTGEGLSRSFPSRTEHITIREEHSMDEDASPDDKHKGAMANQPNSSHVKRTDMMKEALAQIYSSCTRNQSFGEMLLKKCESKADQSPSDDHAHEKTVIKNFVDSTLTTLRESSESDAVVGSDVKIGNPQHRAKGDKEDDMSIDWIMAFDFFDHRRMITFGLVRGLIRRVHQYPLAYEVETDVDESGRDSSSRGDSDDEGDDFSNMDMSPQQYKITSVKMSPEPFHMPMSASMEAAAAAAAKTALDETNRTPSYSPSLMTHGFPTPPVKCRDEILLSNLAKEMQLRSRKFLFERIAIAMDGTRCDDELSCMFEIPTEKLIEMLKSTERWNVISVFSCDSYIEGAHDI